MLAATPLCALTQAPLVRLAQPIDETRVVTLAGNVHPLARGDFDQGAVSGETRLERLLLVLVPTAAQQSALDTLVEAQHNPGSPLFHHWLTPAEYGTRFGVSAQDRARVTAWLASHGFQVEEIPAGRRLVIFSGTAGQVTEAFHTEIHRYRVNGAEHLANALNPQIPVALAGMVGGVVSLHDFRRKSQIKARKAMGTKPEYSSGSTHYLFPGDFAAIYDLNSLYEAGTTGAGTSIAIVGRSNINVGDVAAFREIAALAANTPAVILAGADPGLVKGDQDEATLDVEWSGAVAPGAVVKLVAGASTATTDGVDLAAQYAVNHAVAPVVSTSYGSCEREMSATELNFYDALWEQAASQGMSVFVASGDAGAADCDSATEASGSGAGVNGLCSSPYATCVGGTEFNEGSVPGRYWAGSNSGSYASALSYIPEEAWNESALDGGTGLWATGGGESEVYAAPAWQEGVIWTDHAMRAVPDVALAAAEHDGYVVAENGSHWVVSGTSVAAPSFAGVMALVVQANRGTGQGSANAGLYALVNAELSPFHTTESGNNSVPGVLGFTASGAAYNQATGLGSVDGAVLVSEWGTGGGTGKPAAALTLKAQSSLVVAQGASTTMSLTVETGGSFSGPVRLQVSGLPAGVTAKWSANPVTPAASVSTNQGLLTLTVSPTARAGSTSLVVTATGDGLTASQNLTLQVQQTVIRLHPRVGSQCGFCLGPRPL